MSVKVTKPVTNLREELSALDKPSGIAGETILRANTSFEAFDAVGAGRRNLIINGGFDVWQRATTTGSTTSSGYLAPDRYYLNGSGATYTASRQEFTIGQTEVPGNPRYYLRFAVTGANDNAGFWQRIEDVRRSSGQMVTLSFWARSPSDPPGGSATGRPMNMKYIQDFGSGGSPSANVANIMTFAIDANWQYYRFTFRFPDISGKTLGTNDDSSFDIEWSNPTNETFDFDIANIQLEYGSVATPFERRSYAEELALCQRYYHKEVRSSGALFGFVGMADNSTSAYVQHVFPTTMRAEPAIYTTGTAGDYSIRVSGNTLGCSHVPNLSSANTQVAHVQWRVSSGLTGGHAVIAKFDAADKFVAFDAEL